MARNKAKLVIHPVRLRILQALAGGQMTTGEISLVLPDVPTSSVYRHLRLLLEGELVTVVESREVNGILEKVYGLAQAPFLSRADVQDLNSKAHLEMFTTWLMTALQGFSDYLTRSEAEHGVPDLGADFAGYTEVVFLATEEEMEAFTRSLNSALIRYLKAEPAKGRRKRKLATILHPLE